LGRAEEKAGKAAGRKKIEGVCAQVGQLQRPLFRG
jgi:hypothetical protein